MPSCFFAQYHAHLVHQAGWEAVPRIDVVPQLIWFRLQNDAVGKAGREGATNLYANIAFFVAELIIASVIVGIFATMRASRVYSERVQRWAIEKKLIVQWDDVARIVQGVENEQLEGVLPTLLQIVIPDPQKPIPHGKVTIEYLLNEHEAFGYLSLSAEPKPGQLIRQMELMPAELLSLRSFLDPTAQAATSE